ncbi:hypothetical protein CFO_g2538 [Ceratocystis platani]|uniref:Uncharacterized protein n=1 Tax=Ceratocystis fimbriata f. sp. platani TaxID=88771 RepID=A0A0F8B4D1_CERFI|nr:hypothetical protein CFO_g2538 [Ceratocystis platani]
MSRRSSAYTMASSMDATDADFFAISPCPSPAPMAQISAPLSPPAARPSLASISSCSSLSSSMSYSSFSSPAHCFSPASEPAAAPFASIPAVSESSEPRVVLHSDSHASDRELWNCMLDLQRRYGCYRSARIEAALATESEDLMPSRAILVLMNENAAQMPAEAKSRLSRFITIPDPEEEPLMRNRMKRYRHLRFWRNRA